DEHAPLCGGHTAADCFLRLPQSRGRGPARAISVACRRPTRLGTPHPTPVPWRRATKPASRPEPQVGGEHPLVTAAPPAGPVGRDPAGGPLRRRPGRPPRPAPPSVPAPARPTAGCGSAQAVPGDRAPPLAIRRLRRYRVRPRGAGPAAPAESPVG